MKNIFVCVGTHTQQFDRLLKKIDEIAKDSKDSFFGQIGNSNYKPKNFECKKFFCFDHILAGQIKKGMGENEEIRDICEICVKTHEYHTI